MKIVDLKLDVVPAKLGYEIRHEKEVLGRIYYRPEEDGTDEGLPLATAIKGLPGLILAAKNLFDAVNGLTLNPIAKELLFPERRKLEAALAACLAGEKEAE